MTRLLARLGGGQNEVEIQCVLKPKKKHTETRSTQHGATNTAASYCFPFGLTEVGRRFGFVARPFRFSEACFSNAERTDLEPRAHVKVVRVSTHTISSTVGSFSNPTVVQT